MASRPSAVSTTGGGSVDVRDIVVEEPVEGRAALVEEILGDDDGVTGLALRR